MGIKVLLDQKKHELSVLVLCWCASTNLGGGVNNSRAKNPKIYMDNNLS